MAKNSHPQTPRRLKLARSMAFLSDSHVAQMAEHLDTPATCRVHHSQGPNSTVAIPAPPEAMFGPRSPRLHRNGPEESGHYEPLVVRRFIGARRLPPNRVAAPGPPFLLDSAAVCHHHGTRARLRAALLSAPQGVSP